MILSLLDVGRMEELKRAFVSKDHELSQKEFVSVVWSFLLVKPGEEGLVMNALTHLFRDIDINDDGKMQWSEFSDFLAASQRHSNDQEVALEKYEVDVSAKAFRFPTHGGDIQQLCYSKKYDLIAVLMHHSKEITIFDHQQNEVVNVVKGHRNHIVAMAFLDGFSGIAFPSNIIHSVGSSETKEKFKNKPIIVASSGLDETIIIWLVPCDSSRKRPQRLRTISMNAVHTTVYWSNKRKLLVTADTAHRLYIWDSKLRSVVWKKHYHTDSIVDILLPCKTSILLSASLDTTVIAYDLSSDRVKFRLKAHKRGLIAMAYIGSLHMLVTAAAEHSRYYILCILQIPN